MRWSRSGKATVLQDAAGKGDSQPSAINAFGWSVGSSYTGPANLAGVAT